MTSLRGLLLVLLLSGCAAAEQRPTADAYRQLRFENLELSNQLYLLKNRTCP